jgi:hypothetical protein
MTTTDGLFELNRLSLKLFDLTSIMCIKLLWWLFGKTGHFQNCVVKPATHHGETGHPIWTSKTPVILFLFTVKVIKSSLDFISKVSTKDLATL